MYGSDKPERYVGGKAVAAELRQVEPQADRARRRAKPGAGRQLYVAWIAANVDAVDATKPKTAMPYELLAFYEQLGGTWRLMHANFSFMAMAPPSPVMHVKVRASARRQRNRRRSRDRCSGVIPDVRRDLAQRDVVLERTAKRWRNCW